MRKKFRRAYLLIAAVLTSSFVGCQAWHSSSVMPGLMASKGERLVMKQAKNDPFPSPSDVGLSSTE